MPSIDTLIGGFLELGYHALMGLANFGAFVAILGLGSCVTAAVIGSLVWIIIFIIKVVKNLYDAVKAHYNRGYDCEYCIAQSNCQAPIKQDGPHIMEEEAKQSFDEDARTIVGEGNGKNSVDLTEEGNYLEGNPLLKDDGQYRIEEEKETFHVDGQQSLEEGSDMSSIDLTAKGYPREWYGSCNDDGQHTIEADKEGFDEDGRKSLGEGNETSFVGLNNFTSNSAQNPRPNLVS